MKKRDIYKQLPIPNSTGANTGQSEPSVTDSPPSSEPLLSDALCQLLYALGEESFLNFIKGEELPASVLNQTQHGVRGPPKNLIGNRSSLRRLVTVNQMAAMPEYACFSKSSLRHLIFQAEPRVNSRGEEIPGNGLGGALYRIGSKVLIDLNSFDIWIESHRVQIDTQE